MKDAKNNLRIRCRDEDADYDDSGDPKPLKLNASDLGNGGARDSEGQSGTGFKGNVYHLKGQQRQECGRFVLQRRFRSSDVSVYSVQSVPAQPVICISDPNRDKATAETPSAIKGKKAEKLSDDARLPFGENSWLLTGSCP